MTYLNEITGLAALALFPLVFFGLFPQSASRSSPSTALLAKAILLLGAVAVLRLAYYDLWRSMALSAGWIDTGRLAFKSEMFNAFSNLWFAMSSYLALRAMRASIPDDERDAWPWWRAPFYPGGCPIRVGRRRP